MPFAIPVAPGAFGIDSLNPKVESGIKSLGNCSKEKAEEYNCESIPEEGDRHVPYEVRPETKAESTTKFRPGRNIEKIPLKGISGHQPIINIHNLRRVDGSDPHEPIDVVHADKGYHIRDGNHRATLAHLKGETHIHARVQRSN
jgi:hypothetical protein